VSASRGRSGEAGRHRCGPALVVVALAGLLGSAAAGPAVAAEAAPYIVLASTTSTRDSGLLDWLIPAFRARTGIDVRVVAVGTGRAIRLAERGDADVLLVHHRPSEEAFVRAGHGVERFEVMWNDFVVAGPREDPAGVRGLSDVAVALARIARGGHLFVSRGDESGTHKKEMELWRAAGIDPHRDWGAGPGAYRETGTGMGATLNVASELGAYVLVDRGTWISFRNRGALDLLVVGDPLLRNPYGVILVHPARHPHVKAELGQRFIDWLLSDAGQARIAAFRLEGEVLFHPVRDVDPPAAPGASSRRIGSP